MATNFKGSQYQRYLFSIVTLYKQRQDIKAYLELLLSVATIGIFVILAIKPTLVTISDLLVKINAEQQTSDALDTKITNLGIAQGLFNKEVTNVNLLNSAIPDNPDVPSYSRQVEGAIKKENISAQSITAGTVILLPQNASSSAQSFSLTSAISGTYPSLLNFLKDIENLRRPSQITKLDFTSSLFTLTSKVPYN